MKTLTIVALSLVLSFSLAAEQAAFDNSNCRMHLENIDPELPQSEQIRLDLIEGIWGEKHSTASTLSFHADGSVGRISRNKNGLYTYTVLHWKVEMHSGEPVLYLHDSSQGKDQRFFVEQTCAGINLKDVHTGITSSLSFEETPSSIAANVSRTMVGNWSHSLSVSRLQQVSGLDKEHYKSLKAQVKMEFRPDGSYYQTVECHEAKFKHEDFGRWSISKNGKFLLMESGKDVSGNRCIPIKFLEWDEMVLTQALPAHMATPSKDGFYFNKI